MPTSTLTSKGQITIPREVRDRLRLKTGSRVDFIVEASGQVVLKPLNSNFRSIRGIVRSRRKRPVSIKEMKKPSPEVTPADEGRRHEYPRSLRRQR